MVNIKLSNSQCNILIKHCRSHSKYLARCAVIFHKKAISREYLRRSTIFLDLANTIRDGVHEDISVR